MCDCVVVCMCYRLQEKHVLEMQCKHQRNILELQEKLKLNLQQVCSRDVHEAFLVKTEALTVQAEARPRPRPSELENKTRPRHTNSQARPSRGTTAPRDGIKTEASSPRPHPHHFKD